MEARKRPWELHAIVCLFLIAIGVAVARKTFQPSLSEIEHLMAVGGMTFSLIGLFRGSRVAWWASSAAFASLSGFVIYALVELIVRYGLVAHWRLAELLSLSGLFLATFGLLLSLRLRKAFPASAEPLVADLPAFHAVLRMLAPIVFLVAAAFSLATPVLFATRQDHRQPSGFGSFKTLCSAEADFRANDRDWNHYNDFWTGDVAGLYGIVPPTGDGAMPIKLIEMSVALADGHPVNGLYPPIAGESGPKSGAWFAVLRTDRSSAPPETYGLRNTSRFGFIAYSDDYIGGLKYAFIVNENNTIFRQRVDRNLLGSSKRPPGPPADPTFRDWPGDDELKARWEKLD